MRVERKRQVKSERQVAEEKEDQMEAERQASVIKAEIQAVAVELAFHISDWLQIVLVQRVLIDKETHRS